MDFKALRTIFKPPTILFPAKFILFTAGVVVFLILKALGPLIKIRIGCLRYDRIGHLAVNTELYLRKLTQNNTAVGQYRIFISGKPANRQLLTMIRRRIPVIESGAVLWAYEAMRSFFSDSELWIDLPVMENFYFEFDSITPQLAFIGEEEAKKEELLKSIGVEPDSPFVCFHVRDKAYLSKAFPKRSKGYYSYHSYRNCSIENYLPAIKYLSSVGIFVLRMGYIVEQELKTDDPRIIDYATKHRSDFGDIYLNAKCKFFLASEGGLASISWIFNVPVAYSNAAPPAGVAAWRRTDVFIPKKLWSIEQKRFLTFPEIIARGADRWLASKQFQDAGIEVIENRPDEILGLVKEMNARIDGTWTTTAQDEELQQRYRMIFTPECRCYGFPSRVGAEFLRQNKELLGRELATTNKKC